MDGYDYPSSSAASSSSSFPIPSHVSATDFRRLEDDADGGRDHARGRASPFFRATATSPRGGVRRATFGDVDALGGGAFVDDRDRRDEPYRGSPKRRPNGRRSVSSSPSLDASTTGGVFTAIPSEQSMIHSWIALFLASLLAAASGWDETRHCDEIYGDGGGDNNDDDDGGRRRRRRLEENEFADDAAVDYYGACVDIFLGKVLGPAVVGMVLSGAVVVRLLRLNGGAEQLRAPLTRIKAKVRRRNRRERRRRRRKREERRGRGLQTSERSSSSTTTATATAVPVVANVDHDARDTVSVMTPHPRHHASRKKNNLSQRRLAPSLGFVAFLCAVVWGRGVLDVLLHSPWRCQGQGCEDYDEESDIRNMVSWRVSNSPEELHSLGAVDAMGYVGANANLFYSVWAALLISVRLCYTFSCSPFVHHDDALDENTRGSRSVYRLRERLGTWIALTLCCAVGCLASTRVWRSINAFKDYKIGRRRGGDDDDDGNALSNDRYNDDDVWAIVLEDDDDPIEYLPVLFRRTRAAVAMGLGGASAGVLSALACRWGRTTTTTMVDDNSLRRSRALFLETTLAASFAACYGVGGWYVTGVGGPARSVGNLYYATMAAFLLSSRALVGCLEELAEAHDLGGGDEDGIDEEFELRRATDAKRDGRDEHDDDDAYAHMDGAETLGTTARDHLVNHRPGDMRFWGMIAVFSSINLGSVLDGVSHMDFSPPDDADDQYVRPIDWDLRWMITAPCVAISISSLFFVLHLVPRSYRCVVHYELNAPAAVLTFFCWCTNLVVTMHSPSSLAVNSRGEIVTANQYYFSWASCSTSFLNMLNHVRRGEPESVLAVLWSAVLKISLVMVSASLHVWGNARDDCERAAAVLWRAEQQQEYGDESRESEDEDANDDAAFENPASAAVHLVFCRRTHFALNAAYVGTVLSGVALLSRIRYVRCFAVVELAGSAFLVGLFAFAVYYVTGIDGPGQVVGDLYYATWIVLLCSLVIGESCWEQFHELFVKGKGSNNIGEEEDDEGGVGGGRVIVVPATVADGDDPSSAGVESSTEGGDTSTDDSSLASFRNG